MILQKLIINKKPLLSHSPHQFVFKSNPFCKMFFKAEFILIVLSACALARADAIVNPLVFMDITANGEEVGRLVFEVWNCVEMFS